jgi:uncharacterized protein (TIGR02145 family)
MFKLVKLSLCLLSSLLIVSCDSKKEIEFIPPVLTTIEVTSITQTTAASGGNITSDCGSSITSRGVCWSTKINPTISDSKTTDGGGIGSFASSIKGLADGTTYFVRAYATNSEGTGYGSAYQITTLSYQLPVLTTTSVASVLQTTAICGGNITNDGGSSITARGVCWSTHINPTLADSKTIDSTGTGSFVSNITGLNAGTDYYVRAYATTRINTGYGNEYKIHTLSDNEFFDIDGNIYHAKTIGTQVWMVENLKTTHYRNGESILNTTDNYSWIYYTYGEYCWYNNDITNKAIYGALYNGYAVTDSRNIAPVGWHVATADEWITLINYLGGESVAGGEMKESGVLYWSSPNTDASNESGFTAFPCGSRSKNDGTFGNLGITAGFWSSTEPTPNPYDGLKTVILKTTDATCSPSACSKTYGNAVRCIKN